MRIVELIYEAMTDDEVFATLPAALARAADARSCMLQAFGPGNEILFAASDDYFSPESHAFYVEAGMFHHDPWRGPFSQRRHLNRACSSQQLVDFESYQRSVFYNDFFRQFGDDTAHCLGSVMPHQGGCVTLGIHRGVTAEGFSEMETAAMQPVIPHLRCVLVVKARLHTANTERVNANRLLDALPYGVLVVDHGRRLIYANASAEALLRSSDALIARAGRIIARGYDEDTRLDALIVTSTRGIGSRGGGLVLTTSSGSSLRLTVSPWRMGERTRAVIMVDAPTAPDPALAVKLVGLYGMTSAEAEVAAMLAEGRSPTAIAATRGVSLATVRSQIHQALEKTDTRSLADLVRLAVSIPRLEAPI